ncbi:MAG: sigma-54 interaction domain-containing protein [Bacteroidales bacterium]
MDLQSVKQRFGIIGNHPGLNRAINIAIQVAPTDLSVLITGPSGAGKEIFPQIIHHFSARKHGPYIAVNCGAIPEGTIDSELFGHEKGSFTGAHESRKGYFEVANGGTIFLDEVAELPLATQVRLLRVLETGEFLKVGSSKVQKTNVRVVAATNVDIPTAIQNGKFREDLFYRLNTVPISVPALKERKEDIYLLFRKFASDFAEKYRMPAISLDEEAIRVLENYDWPGNVRQLKNITEQISIIEKKRVIDAETLKMYLPNYTENKLPVLFNRNDADAAASFASEREILYKILFDMKADMNDLKKLVYGLIQTGRIEDFNVDHQSAFNRLYKSENDDLEPQIETIKSVSHKPRASEHIEDTHEVIEETLSLQEKEKELIIKALNKHNGKRKLAAEELGISERTLYRKIKEYDLD